MQKEASGKTGASKKGKGGKNAPEPPPPPPPPRKSRKKKILAVLILLGLAVGGAFFLLRLLPEQEKPAVYPAEALVHLSMEDELLAFVWRYLPESYEALRGLNAELRLINEEIQRIEGIASRFPDQNRIPQTEIREWEGLKKEVETTVSRARTNLTALYVTHLVNAGKGETAIAQETAAITSDLKSLLTRSREKTRILSEDPLAKPPSMLDRIVQWLPWKRS